MFASLWKWILVARGHFREPGKRRNSNELIEVYSFVILFMLLDFSLFWRRCNVYSTPPKEGRYFFLPLWGYDTLAPSLQARAIQRRSVSN